MAETSGTANASREPDNMKQSFAWAQLFVGSIISAPAVWKLLHKMTNTEPSEWFLGLSRAYEAVRDFAMTPFEWVNLALTDLEENLLVICAVIVGATVRAMPPLVSAILLMLIGIILAMEAVGYEGSDFPLAAFGLDGIRNWVAWVTFVLVTSSVAGSLLGLVLGDSSDMLAAYWLTLLNIFFALLLGNALLLLNWATS